MDGLASSSSQYWLYEGQISCVAVVLRQEYYTVYCLRDEFFDKRSRLESSEQDEHEGADGSVDPVIKVARTAPGPALSKDPDASTVDTRADPRCYWLQALASNMALCVKETENIMVAINRNISQYVRNKWRLFRVSLLWRCQV